MRSPFSISGRVIWDEYIRPLREKAELLMNRAQCKTPQSHDSYLMPSVLHISGSNCLPVEGALIIEQKSCPNKGRFRKEIFSLKIGLTNSRGFVPRNIFYNSRRCNCL